MPEEMIKISICNCQAKNKKNIIHLFNSISYCIKCNSFIFEDLSTFESTIKVIKPNKYKIKEENLQNLQWLAKDCKPDEFLGNKKDYLKIRSKLIKNIKNFCSFFSLSLKTYFSSIAYLDKICFKLCLFNESILIEISLFCIILATKFFEKKEKAFQVQAYLLKENISKNYKFDEIYALQLLNYDLNVHTSYDILMDILYLGFIFENEEFKNYNRLNVLYNNIPKILYIFSESNSYINMTSKQIAICIVGFFRDLLGLVPFNENIQKIFMINNNNENTYISGLNTIKKRIKIE